MPSASSPQAASPPVRARHVAESRVTVPHVSGSQLPGQSSAGVMRTAVISAPQQVEIVERPVPEPRPHQIRVRLEGCGVCASNVPVWEGREWFEYPRPAGSPGHEGWGRVDAAGAEVAGLVPGDRVGILSEAAFAEFDVVDAACAVRLPPELDGVHFPAEPLACAVNVFDRSGIEAGQTVAVVGIGFLGGLLVQLSKSIGARVVAISRRPSALDLAAACGADEVVPMDERERVLSRVSRLTQDAGCDCVIEATGYQQPLDLAAELVRIRGRLVIAGYHQDGLRQVNMQSWNWRGIDVINAHERDEAIYVRGMQRAAEVARRGELHYGQLLTDVFPLENLADALETARQRPAGFVKAVVVMNGSGVSERNGGRRAS
jgi:threonine dehydrogenase-like Zn-dependent dehydrogenase